MWLLGERTTSNTARRKERPSLIAWETLGVDLRKRVERLGAKEQARRKKCNVRFLIIKKDKAFQKNYMKVGVKKLLRAGIDLGSPRSGELPHRKV